MKTNTVQAVPSSGSWDSGGKNHEFIINLQLTFSSEAFLHELSSAELRLSASSPLRTVLSPLYHEGTAQRLSHGSPSVGYLHSSCFTEGWLRTQSPTCRFLAEIPLVGTGRQNVTLYPYEKL